MRMMVNIAVATVLLSAASESVGQTRVRAVHVYAENDRNGRQECPVDDGAIVRAVESTYRELNYTIASREDAINGRALIAYINLNVRNREGRCYGSATFELQEPAIWRSRVFNRRFTRAVPICSQSGIFNFAPAEVAERITNAYGNPGYGYASQCQTELSLALLSNEPAEAFPATPPPEG